MHQDKSHHQGTKPMVYYAIDLEGQRNLTQNPSVVKKTKRKKKSIMFLENSKKSLAWEFDVGVWGWSDRTT